MRKKPMSEPTIQQLLKKVSEKGYYYLTNNESIRCLEYIFDKVEKNDNFSAEESDFVQKLISTNDSRLNDFLISKYHTRKGPFLPINKFKEAWKIKATTLITSQTAAPAAKSETTTVVTDDKTHKVDSRKIPLSKEVFEQNPIITDTVHEQLSKAIQNFFKELKEKDQSLLTTLIYQNKTLFKIIYLLLRQQTFFDIELTVSMVDWLYSGLDNPKKVSINNLFKQIREKLRSPTTANEPMTANELQQDSMLLRKLIVELTAPSSSTLTESASKTDRILDEIINQHGSPLAENASAQFPKDENAAPATAAVIEGEAIKTPDFLTRISPSKKLSEKYSISFLNVLADLIKSSKLHEIKTIDISRLQGNDKKLFSMLSDLYFSIRKYSPSDKVAVKRLSYFLQTQLGLDEQQREIVFGLIRSVELPMSKKTKPILNHSHTAVSGSPDSTPIAAVSTDHPEKQPGTEPARRDSFGSETDPHAKPGFEVSQTPRADEDRSPEPVPNTTELIYSDIDISAEEQTDVATPSSKPDREEKKTSVDEDTESKKTTLREMFFKTLWGEENKDPATDSVCGKMLEKWNTKKSSSPALLSQRTPSNSGFKFKQLSLDDIKTPNDKKITVNLLMNPKEKDEIELKLSREVDSEKQQTWTCESNSDLIDEEKQFQLIAAESLALRIAQKIENADKIGIMDIGDPSDKKLSLQFNCELTTKEEALIQAHFEAGYREIIYRDNLILNPKLSSGSTYSP